MLGGFALGPSRFHSRINVAIGELFFMFSVHVRPIRRARHFASTSIKSRPTCLFRFCRVDIGARNVPAVHMYHAIAVVNCRVYVVGAENTWALCHVFARTYACT